MQFVKLIAIRFSQLSNRFTILVIVVWRVSKRYSEESKLVIVVGVSIINHGKLDKRATIGVRCQGNCFIRRRSAIAILQWFCLLWTQWNSTDFSKKTDNFRRIFVKKNFQSRNLFCDPCLRIVGGIEGAVEKGEPGLEQVRSHFSLKLPNHNLSFFLHFLFILYSKQFARGVMVAICSSQRTFATILSDILEISLSSAKIGWRRTSRRLGIDFHLVS